MKGKLYILFCLTLLGLVGCSTQKNTWASRSFHQTKTKYNIHHNGQIAFADGLEAINEAHDDDFSTTLPLYPVSNHEAAQAATSHMDRTIEKCRKCIKLHSIKVKPKKVNHEKRRRDPNYTKPLCRSTSYTTTATALDRLRHRAPGRMGMRMVRSGSLSSRSSGRPFVSLPNNSHTSPCS